MIYKEFFLIAFTFILMIPFVQKAFRQWMISLVIGMFCMFVAGDLNALLLEYFTNSFLDYTCTISPITEEMIKFIPIFFICRYLIESRENAISCSCAIGLGFALMESFLYLLQSAGAFTVIQTIARALSSASAHGLSSYIFAVGILRSKKYKTGTISGLFSVLCVNIVLHSIYNVIGKYGYPVTIYIAMGVVYLVLYFNMYAEQRKRLVCYILKLWRRFFHVKRD